MLEQIPYFPMNVQFLESFSRNFKSEALELLSTLALYTTSKIRDFPSIGFQ